MYACILQVRIIDIVLTVQIDDYSIIVVKIVAFVDIAHLIA